MLKTQTFVLGGLMAALATLFQTIPALLTEVFAFVTMLSALPIYAISRISPRTGLLVFITTSILVSFISPHEGLFLLFANGPVGLTLGICHHYTGNKSLISLVTAAVTTCTLSILIFVINVSVFPRPIPGPYWIHPVILFLFMTVYSSLYYQGIKDVKVKEVNDPKIEKPDDAIIRVTSTAICGSDLHLIHGMVPNMPRDFILDHETMGIVEETGPDVTKIKKGDRVIVPFPVSCGHCWYCEHDLWSQCDNSNPHAEMGGIFGYSETYGGYAGGQAEYLRVPYANVGPLVIEGDIPDERVLFLTDILPTAYWGTDIAGIKPEDTVIVLGCGPVGLLTQKCAWLKGAKRVIAVDYIDYRIEHARKFNNVETVNFTDVHDTGRHLKEVTHGGADVVLDCVGMDGKMSVLEMVETAAKLQGGSMSAIVMAAQAVRKGGTVALVGVYGARYNQFPLGDFFARNIT